MYKRLPQWIVFYEQYINIEIITVNTLGTVVNMLFIKYTKLLLIEINMYMVIFLSPFFSYFFFLDLGNDGNNGNRVSEARNRPSERNFRDKITVGKLVQLNHAVESPLY